MFSAVPSYCLAKMTRISASLSWITSPLTSNVTRWIVPALLRHQQEHFVILSHPHLQED
jgi:hypothetical protein